MQPDIMVSYGGELKALGNGKVGGLMVVYSPDEKKDLVGTFFNKDTYYGASFLASLSADSLFQHGFPIADEFKSIANHRFAPWKASFVDAGIWGETVLNMADEYEKMVYEFVETGKCGLSTGSTMHMIEQTDTGWIKTWPIIECSFTPTPAEPRTVGVVSLKSLLESIEKKDSGELAAKTLGEIATLLKQVRHIKDAADYFENVEEGATLNALESLWYRFEDMLYDCFYWQDEMSTEDKMTAIQEGLAMLSEKAAALAQAILGSEGAEDEAKSLKELQTLRAWALAIDVSSIKTERDFEKFLRDARFPKVKAMALAGHGWKDAANRRDAGDESWIQELRLAELDLVSADLALTGANI